MIINLAMLCGTIFIYNFLGIMPNHKDFDQVYEQLYASGRDWTK